ncbi:MAG: Uncharacterized protein FD143_2120 [Ignavibacteria bacterium]|nr:MAG: Uncharacterized protein FD143_2120 [Ignavibacteria bacterium]KAF0158926.1 MAG: Uncharacterized protein FD188_2408 [Ignavibacteria bacterium]
MILEFALDPEVISNWKDFNRFTSQFGCETGRMISRFPKKWKKLVYDCCQTNTDLTPIKLKRIEEILHNDDLDFDKKFVRNHRDYNSNTDWITNAIASNRIKEFHAIISNTKNDGSLYADDIDEFHEKWKNSTSKAIKRTVNDLGSCFKPFFEMSNQLLIMDSHFDPGTPRYFRAFRKYFELIFSVSRDHQRIEIHTSDKIEANHFITEFKKNFFRYIPVNKKIDVIRWVRLEDGENQHPRYLLTEFGGINVDYGFDEGVPNETTDVSLLGHTLYKQRWENIQENSTVYRIKEKITFAGTINSLEHQVTIQN